MSAMERVNTEHALLLIIQLNLHKPDTVGNSPKCPVKYGVRFIKVLKNLTNHGQLWRKYLYEMAKRLASGIY